MAVMRLQKILASAGVASRRKAEEFIAAGRVAVNGKIVTELGAKADPGRDSIEVDGTRLAAQRPILLLMNKPRGVVSTAKDPEGRETVLDLVKGYDARLFPVGRLDYATSGALLLTNDGDVAYALTHPKHGVEKTYHLKIKGMVSEEVLDKWRRGVDIGDVVTRPAEVCRVEQEENFTWIEVTIKEGKNRQLRRMAEATGLQLVKLKRIAFAGLTIKGLKIGEVRELTEKEKARLLRDYVNPANRARKSSRAPSLSSEAEDRKTNVPNRFEKEKSGRKNPEGPGPRGREPRGGFEAKKQRKRS